MKTMLCGIRESIQKALQDDYGWGSENASDVGTSSAEDYELAMFRENHLQNPRLKQFLEAAGQVHRKLT